MSPPPNFRTDSGTRQIPPAAATNPSHRLFVEAGSHEQARLARSRRRDAQPTCRHLPHSPLARSGCPVAGRADDTHRDLATVRRKTLEIAIAAAQTSRSYGGCPAIAASSFSTWNRTPACSATTGVRDFMTSIRPTVSPTPTGSPGPEGRLTRSGRPVERAREWCLDRLSTHESDCSGTRVAEDADP
jgi:hypothetical protein